MIEILLLLAGGAIAWRSARTEARDVGVNQAVRFCTAGHPIALDAKECRKCKRIARDAERERKKTAEKDKRAKRCAVSGGTCSVCKKAADFRALTDTIVNELAIRDANCTGGAPGDRCYTLMTGDVMHGAECDAAWYLATRPRR